MFEHNQSPTIPKIFFLNLKLPSNKGIEEFCSSFGELRVLDNCVADVAVIQRAAYKSKEAHFTIILEDSKGSNIHQSTLLYS